MSFESREILEYIKSRVASNPSEPDIYWLPKKVTCKEDKIFNSRHAGKSIGCDSIDAFGSPRRVFSITYGGKQYRMSRSRVKWAIHNETWPEGHIDHISRNTLDDRLENLRVATNEENSANKVAYSNNSSGVKGVRFNKKINKWTARITKSYKEIHLGCFDTLDGARKAYHEAAVALNGEFARSE